MTQTSSTVLTEYYGQRILWGEWLPGHRFTLDELMTESGKSRTVVREVMRELEGLGLIAARRRVGLEVLRRESWNVFDPRVVRWQLDGPGSRDQYRALMEMRRAVEPVAGELAAARASAAQRAELLALSRQMRAAGASGDLPLFLSLDIRFHQLVLTASGNPLFRALGSDITEVLIGRTSQGRMPAHPRRGALDLHETAALAISEGDDDAARSALSALTEGAWHEVDAGWGEGGMMSDKNR